MNKYIIAYDLGTGGIKASLYNDLGKSLASSFVPYDTYYPFTGWHEQRPMDWWNAVVESTQNLLMKVNIDKNDIEGIGISGHSLGVVPIDQDGNLLRDTTPIWSDGRAVVQAQKFFQKVDEEKWYMTTGNGFPAPLYSIFKIMWYKDNEPEMFKKVDKFIGTKDYINFMLTGIACTDYSYASGSGVYNLEKWKYEGAFIEASGICESVLPKIVPSTKILGNLTKEAAKILGLPNSIKVVCGGVDNACMALGARGINEGRVYTSLGSSAWIAVTSTKPIVNAQKRPYVFTHCIPGMFTSATCIFAAGSSLKWVRDNICKDMIREGEEKGIDPYIFVNKAAEDSPIGAKKLLFNPSLAGGSGLDKSPRVRGGFIGLDLGHTQGDMIRATMEGIAMNLRIALDVLGEYTQISKQMLIVGGGGKSKLWRQIFADTYNKEIIKTNVGQDAGSLGAAACAAVGIGLWKDFSIIDEIHKIKEVVMPNQNHNEIYEKYLEVFRNVSDMQSDIGDMLHEL
ncbi:MAG: FGGY-family carbohydrate kinase [Marinisporobacter sp.]|nr:FGGY-family carbohydrate kinase [Marinisporobacter sp.]